ncbi:MAG: mannose-6-phosphate isomerase [Dysgonamonadaceae bacterium]|nr:mannose-6-phosphate isomerase [Dysgonamonadaceae bacterium]MDD4728770.1 mannose-6-phosphate isomerase [Dysgonamonadaceae bacterium]
MKLYPLKFEPILKSIIWGGSEIPEFKNLANKESGIGESWEISAVENNVSIIANGSLAGKKLDDLIDEAKGNLLGNKIYDKFGSKFPLLIKFIDAQDDLSIQVHPDDKLAKERHNSFGKTEMWYVVKAKSDAFIVSGFKDKITPEQYLEKVNDNTFTDTLQKYKAKEGDVYFLPAGRVHAIGSGCFIAEIQQTSYITYRIYDYNRKDAQGKGRELHTELAKDAIDYNVYDTYKTDYKSTKNKPVELVSCKYFTTNLLELDNEIKQDIANIDSFIIYMCLEGSCHLEDDKGNKITINQGETILIPAQTKHVTIVPNKNVKLLETFVK